MGLVEIQDVMPKINITTCIMPPCGIGLVKGLCEVPNPLEYHLSAAFVSVTLLVLLLQALVNLAIGTFEGRPEDALG